MVSQDLREAPEALTQTQAKVFLVPRLGSSGGTHLQFPIRQDTIHRIDAMP